MNQQFMAMALLLRKFGKPAPDGGYKVEVSYDEIMALSPHGTLQEVPEIDRRVISWIYYPNNTIEGELATPKTPESKKLEAPETESDPTV